MKHPECVLSQLRKRRITLNAQNGRPFTCPFEGMRVDAATETVAAIRADGYNRKLRELNPKMGHVEAINKMVELRGIVLEMANLVFKTSESNKSFFNQVGSEGFAPVLCCLCQQLAGEGSIVSTCRDPNGNPYAAWPGHSHMRRGGRIEINSSACIDEE